MTELEALAILSTIPALGGVKIRFLLQHFGSALAALQTPAEEIKQLQGFEKVVPYWNSWHKNLDWRKDLDLILEHQTSLIPFTHPQFPKRLLEISDHPAMIYVRGNFKPQDERCIAIVGTRNASIYGNEMARAIAKDLASHGFTVVSGLARGVDTAAHNGALERGRTLAVIGSGLANIYPAENTSLANAIAQQGALISEFPMSTAPDRQNFPQRNRIVSGMTLATVLIEAPIKSGAMITMEKAATQKRELFALPGRADHDNFRGNHMLIKRGQATLVENAQDILAHFQDLFSFAPQNRPIATRIPHLDAQETGLLNSMPIEELNIEELAQRTSLPIQQIQRLLMSLILKKMVKEFPGKIYKKQL